MSTLLQVHISDLTTGQVGDVLQRFLLTKKQHHIVTVNPEILMYARRDGGYREILNRSSLNVADGVGITLAGRLHGCIFHRITGFDLVMKLMRIATEERTTVFFLGGHDAHLAHRAALNVKKRFPGLHIVGAESGPQLRMEGTTLVIDRAEQDLIVDHLNLLKPRVLLVGFGHPKQEKWIAQTLSRLPSVRIVLGVGGVFDYLAETVVRAPKVMRAAGLEWLFRLLRQPWRLPRILTATIAFSFAVLHDKR